MSKEFIVKTEQDYLDLFNYVNGDLRKYVVSTHAKNFTFKPFDVRIDTHKKEKSYKQLQGFYRIAKNLKPYLEDWTQEHWDEKRIKQFFKMRYGYATAFKGVMVCKSFKDASMDDLIGVIKEMQKFGDEMDLPQEITELKKYDQLAMEEFYKINKEGKNE